MNILQMSMSAGLLAIAAVIIRAVALNKLPKTMFLILWGVVLLRLLVPVSIPSQFSVYSIIDAAFNKTIPETETYILERILPIRSPVTEAAKALGEKDTPEIAEVIRDTNITEAPKVTNETEATERIAPVASKQVLNIPPITIIWLVGMIAMFIFFAVIYFINQRTLRFSVPIRDNDLFNEWLAGHRLLRPIIIMQSDRITTPVAVGILKPRIILPKSMNMGDKQLLQYVFTHEYYHIRRFDTFWKLLFAFASCIHWFNPMVWVMFVLVNRDLELTCDEMVIRHFGTETKTAYAYSIIGMAEQRSKFTPLYNGFSKNAAEERIRAIMKYKKSSLIVIALAVLLVIGTTTAFAFSATVDANSNANLSETQDLIPPSSDTEKAEKPVSNTFTQPDIVKNVESANHWTSPLRIYESGVRFDGSDYRWPYNTISISNIGSNAIKSYEIGCLAYDKDGNPIELYWDADNVAANGEVGSVGFGAGGVDYGIVTDILPHSPKSYLHIYSTKRPQWQQEEIIQETKTARQTMEQEMQIQLQEQIDEMRVNIREQEQIMQEKLEQDIFQEWKKERYEWLQEWERERQKWFQEWLLGRQDWQREQEQAIQDDMTDMLLPGHKIMLHYSLFDGWNQSSGEHYAAFIISCVKQLIFEDGSVWVNPEYDSWLANYQEKPVAVSTLENYYKQTYKQIEPDIKNQYAIYEQYGLTYKANEDRIYYKDQIVRYFIDRYNNGQGILSIWAYDFDGTIDLYAVRNNVGLHGELIGIEAYSQEDFNLRTKEIEAEQNNIPDYDVMTFRFSKDEAPDSLQLWIRQCEDDVFDFCATQQNGRYYIYVRGETEFGFSVESDGDERRMKISSINGVEGDGYALFSVPLYKRFSVTYNEAVKSFSQ